MRLKNWRKANLGRAFEEKLEWQNMRYLQLGVAQVHRVPTAWIPIRNNYGEIVTAKVEKKAAVDFMGIWAEKDGKSIAFDAKQFSGKSFPLKNIPDHQVEFIRRHTDMGGIGFIILDWLDEGTTLLLPGVQLAEAIERAASGGRKSLSESELQSLPVVGSTSRGPCDYLLSLGTV